MEGRTQTGSSYLGEEWPLKNEGSTDGLYTRLKNQNAFETGRGAQRPALPELGGAPTGAGFLGTVHTPHTPLHTHSFKYTGSLRAQRGDP